MRLVEAQCVHRKHCYPEIPLGSPPTSRASQDEVLTAISRIPGPPDPNAIAAAVADRTAGLDAFVEELVIQYHLFQQSREKLYTPPAPCGRAKQVPFVKLAF